MQQRLVPSYCLLMLAPAAPKRSEGKSDAKRKAKEDESSTQTSQFMPAGGSTEMVEAIVDSYQSDRDPPPAE